MRFSLQLKLALPVHLFTLGFYNLVLNLITLLCHRIDASRQLRSFILELLELPVALVLQLLIAALQGILLLRCLRQATVDAVQISMKLFHFLV